MKKTLLALIVMGSVGMADEMDDFIGGVYDRNGIYGKTKNVAVGDGVIIKVGNTFFTDEGICRKAGSFYFNEKDIVLSTGKSFISENNFTVKSENVYVGTAGFAVSTKSIIIK